tara:strand:- start:1000 stop:1302 length:303 start_codon:yes stop_codon:yes gene_type:complete
MIPQVILKIILPKIMDQVAKVFKLDKVLSYVEQDNELDVQMRDIEQKCTDIGFKVTAMQTLIKDLDDKSHPKQDFNERIDKLEEFEKQVRRKKAFKRKNG